MGINLLLVDLGSPHNIGRIMRESHDLGGIYCRLFIYDPRDILTYNKDGITLTSMERGGYQVIEDLETFLRNYAGRVVATDITQDAVSHREFAWQENDLILLGNENRGYKTKELVTPQGMERVTHRVVIPMLGVACPLPDRDKVVPAGHDLYPNISVASSAALVLSEALHRLGYYKDFILDPLKRKLN